MPALTGRDAELSRIEGAARPRVRPENPPRCWSRASRASARAGCCASCLTAPQSVGSRLVEARADEWARDVPFAALAEALDPVLAERRDLVTSLDPREQRGLAAVAPRAARRGPGAAPGAGSGTWCTRPWARCSRRSRGSTGCLLVLDDVQWADPATIEVLAGLLPPAARGSGARRRGQPCRTGPAAARLGAGRAAARGSGRAGRARPAQQGGRGAAARRSRRRGPAGPHLRAERRQPLLPRAARPHRRRPGPRRRRAARAGRRAGLAGRRAGRAGTAERMVLECASVVGDPFDLEIVEEVARARGARRAGQPARPGRWCGRRRPRGASSSGTRWSGPPSTSTPAAAGASAPTAGRPLRSPPGVRRRSSAPRTSSTWPARATLDALATFAEAARDALSRSPVAASHWYDAALRILPAAGSRRPAPRASPRPGEGVGQREPVHRDPGRARGGHRRPPGRRRHDPCGALLGVRPHRDPHRLPGRRTASGAAPSWPGWRTAGTSTPSASGGARASPRVSIRDFETATSSGLRALELLDRPRRARAWRRMSTPSWRSAVLPRAGTPTVARSASRRRPAALLERAQRSRARRAPGRGARALVRRPCGSSSGRTSLRLVDLGLRAAQEHGVPRAPLPAARRTGPRPWSRWAAWTRRSKPAPRRSARVRSVDYPQAICVVLRSHAQRPAAGSGGPRTRSTAVEEALVVHEGEPKGFLADAEPEWTAATRPAGRGQPQRAQQLMLAGFGGSELPHVVPLERAAAHETLVEAALALERPRHRARATPPPPRRPRPTHRWPRPPPRAALPRCAWPRRSPAAASSALDARTRGARGHAGRPGAGPGAARLRPGPRRVRRPRRRDRAPGAGRGRSSPRPGPRRRRAACAQELRRLGRRAGSAPRRPGSARPASPR